MSSSLRADEVFIHRTDPQLVAACRLEPRASGNIHRTLLGAFGHPGRIVELPDEAPHAPRVLLVGLALADVGVRVAVLEDEPLWGPVLAAATDATLVGPERAEIVIAMRHVSSEELAALPRGTALAPELGATLVVRVDELGAGDVRLDLCGPGVDGTRELAVRTSQSAVIDHLLCSRLDYPTGVDTILEAGGRVVGLPRSTSISEKA